MAWRFRISDAETTRCDTNLECWEVGYTIGSTEILIDGAGTVDSSNMKQVTSQRQVVGDIYVVSNSIQHS
jgi:hypothetical protein